MLFLDEAIRARRSVRSFSGKRVEKSDIVRVLQAGTLAPSAKNRQPWKFIVLTDEQRSVAADAMRRWAKDNAGDAGSVAHSADILKDAPVAIAVCSPARKRWASSDYISLGACMENMCLKATDLGLGSLIVCDVWCVEHFLRSAFDVRAEISALLLLGYASEQTARPRVRKPLRNVVSGIETGAEDYRCIDDLPNADTEGRKFIFISYSHQNTEVVISDIVELKHHGVALWYDRQIAYGEPWDKKALSVLASDDCVGAIVYISKSSVKSDAVRREVGTALGNHKPVVSVHIGDMPLAAYFGESCDDPFYASLNASAKFVSRSGIAAYQDCIEEIVSVCADWGAVARSGVYDSFDYEMIPDGVRILSYKGTSETVTVPARISGRPVVEIGINAIARNPHICRIDLPGSVTTVRQGAFRGNGNLTAIDLPDSIHTIEAAAFRDCVSLRRIVIPRGITVLSEALFRGCSHLTDCEIPYGVTELEEAVFNGCSALEKIRLPETVRKMTEGGFFGCSALRELHIPASIEGLEKDSFATCPHLTVTAGGFAYAGGKGRPLADGAGAQHD